MGFLLITFGATWIGVRLAGDRGLPLAIGLAALCVLLPFMTFDASIDPLAEAALTRGLRGSPTSPGSSPPA